MFVKKAIIKELTASQRRRVPFEISLLNIAPVQSIVHGVSPRVNAATLLAWFGVCQAWTRRDARLLLRCLPNSRQVVQRTDVSQREAVWSKPRLRKHRHAICDIIWKTNVTVIGAETEETGDMPPIIWLGQHTECPPQYFAWLSRVSVH